MRAWLKIIIGVVTAVIVVIVVALVALLVFFDPNDYKAQIDAALSNRIGRQVTIDGDIGLSVFPWLGFDLGRVTLANAPGFADEPMATAKSAHASVRVLPLLHRKIHVGAVDLDGLRLRLARNAKGRSNWAGIAAHMAAKKDSEAPPPEPKKGDSEDQAFDFGSVQIGAIKIENAAVFWSDATTGADYRLTDVNVQTGRLADGQPFRLEADAKINAPKADVDAKVNLVAKIQPHLADRRYRFAPLKLNVIANGKAIPGERQQADVTASGGIDLAAGRFELAKVDVQAAGLNMTGHLQGHLAGQHGDGKLAYTGRIAIDEFDPAAVLRQLQIEPPATRSRHALSSAHMTAQIDGGGKRVKLEKLEAKLDDSTLSGHASIRNFKQPNIGFDFDIDTIDVDDYRPPDDTENEKGDQAGQSSGDESSAQSGRIDLGPLKTLRMDGRLHVASLVAANISIHRAELALRAHNGVLTVAPLTAALYGGTLRVHARVDAGKAKPRYAVKGKLSGLQFEPLLADVAGIQRLAATGKLDFDLDTSGDRVATIKRALGGDIGFELKDGAFSGFNLAQIIAAARRQIAGSGQSAARDGVSSSARTPFNRLAGHFDIQNGVLQGRDIKLKAHAVDATASGKYDLADNALDYTVEARVDENASGALSDLAGMAVPIKLTGNLGSPSYTIDVSRLARELAQKQVDKQKNKIKKKLRKKLDETGGKLGDQLQKGLSNIFGGDARKDKSSH